MSEREIDARVARALGLEVVGEAICNIYPDDMSWHVSYDQEPAFDQAQHPVYLAHCVCHLEQDDLEDEPVIHGHRPGCLEVVPCYSTDIRAAMQIWDTMPWPRFYTRLTVTGSGHWRFDVDLHGGDGPRLSALSDTRPMAICLGFLAVMERLGKL